MPARRIHLVSNAHLDPVWQWRWEEGAAEAITTFGIAARLLREFPGFIFNHNEAILYRWVMEHDPALFDEIRRLVKEGRWCIAGGWDLQFAEYNAETPAAMAYNDSLSEVFLALP